MIFFLGIWQKKCKKVIKDDQRKECFKVQCQPEISDFCLLDCRAGQPLIRTVIHVFLDILFEGERDTEEYEFPASSRAPKLILLVFPMFHAEEPERLELLIEKLSETWKAQKSSQNSIRDAATETLHYIPLFKALLDAKAEPDDDHAQLFAETLIDIVLATESDVAVQARWGAILQRILRTHRRKLSLNLSWRPWYTMLRNQNIEPVSSFVGMCSHHIFNETEPIAMFRFLGVLRYEEHKSNVLVSFLFTYAFFITNNCDFGIENDSYCFRCWSKGS